jgi:hypothetical protein
MIQPRPATTADRRWERRLWRKYRPDFPWSLSIRTRRPCARLVAEKERIDIQVGHSSAQRANSPGEKMSTSFSFKELRGAIRAWRRYGFFSLNEREAEIIDAVYSRLTARPLKRLSGLSAAR